MGQLTSFTLSQNFPNPFNPSTVIAYELFTATHVTLKVYDTLGREMATLASGAQPAGMYSVRWDSAGNASGLYFAHMEGGGQVQVKKLLLCK
jgi:hypothetical protein